MAKWKQMKMIVGSIMVGALLMPTMSITAWANAETEVTVDNFESEILPNLAIKEDGTPLKVAITVAELDSEYVIAVQKYAQYLLETAGAEQKERTLLLFEDVNIQKLLGVERIKEICAFPIRFSQLEAAPVAMVAITDHI